MVKIAITVMLFALLAVCFAARIPREVASQPKEGDVQHGIFSQLNKIIQDNKFLNTLTDEGLKVLKNIGGHLPHEVARAFGNVTNFLLGGEIGSYAH